MFLRWLEAYMNDSQDHECATTDTSADTAIVSKTAKTAFHAIVSLEPWTSPIVTWRGEVIAANMSTAAARAIRSARKAFPGQHAKSISLVVEKI